MENIILTARFIFGVINLTILTVLVYFFFKRYREVKSTFTLGFLLFALALFFKTFFSAPIIKVFIFGVKTSNVVGPYMLIADIFETISLLIFIYITTR
ncbi:MAG TPA: hypothetical protein ENH28_05950 [Euryarchaeota archaeon]|nr:hypothetical protein BMS3Bbin15_01166 [archaeon BMS3Bbin15]HDL15675.1 hypothetical protein [Euryarchaeota archaeon]